MYTTVAKVVCIVQEGELEDLVQDCGGYTVLDSYYDQGNWCVVAQKVQ